MSARPYGLLGLTISLAVMILAAALVCSLLAAAAFGVAALGLGLQGTRTLVHDLNPSDGADTADRLNIVVGLLVYAVLVGVILVAARVRGHASWRDLVAWHPWHPFRGARVFWILLAVTLVYSLGADWLVTKIHPEAEGWVPTPKGLIWEVGFFVLAAILAPVSEELMFRGWIYTSLRQSIGLTAALLLSSALFAMAHWESTHLYALAIFPVGIALAVMRERTGSIVASISFHALYNAFASVLLITSK